LRKPRDAVTRRPGDAGEIPTISTTFVIPDRVKRGAGIQSHLFATSTCHGEAWRAKTEAIPVTIKASFLNAEDAKDAEKTFGTLVTPTCHVIVESEDGS
jgi:hypothetical protein